MALFALFSLISFFKPGTSSLVLLVFSFACLLAILTQTIQLVAALTVEIPATVDTNSNHTIVLFLLGALLLRWSIVNNHSCKTVPAYIKDGMYIGRKEIPTSCYTRDERRKL